MAPPGKTWAGSLLAFSALLAIGAGIVFLTFPNIDVSVSRLFQRADGTFYGQEASSIATARKLFGAILYVSIFATLAGLALAMLRARSCPRPSAKQWLYLGICLAVGPGVLANLVLKEHWGRARPRQVVEFGGSKTFAPALIPSDQCSHNCSFVSGEATSMFMPFYAASLVVPQHAAAMLVVGTVAGLAAGLVRMSAGAHFLSDVIFAGIFMAMTAALLHMAMFGRRAPEEDATARA